MSNMKLAAYEIEEIEAEIATLENRERTLIGSDAGTHGKPLNHQIYEEITGERYATASFAGSNATRCSEQSAHEDTEGRIQYFPDAIQGLREAQAELKKLRKQLASA